MRNPDNVLNQEGAGKKRLFLSPDWVDQAVKTVQLARVTDKQFRGLVRGLTLDLVYLIWDIPPSLRSFYSADRLTIFVELERGKLRNIWSGTEAPSKEADFTVGSDYETFKRIYVGQINAATAFVNRDIKVEPMSRIYRNPAFSARSISTGNHMLRILQQVPTAFERPVLLTNRKEWF